MLKPTYYESLVQFLVSGSSYQSRWNTAWGIYVWPMRGNRINHRSILLGESALV